jgi:hypothetical protein
MGERCIRPELAAPRTALPESEDANETRDAQMAGTAAASSPSTQPTVITTAATVQSTAMVSRRGMLSGLKPTRRRVPQVPTSTAVIRPPNPSMTPSIKVARTTAAPLAPSARESANSRSRSAAQASNNEARFTVNTSTRSTMAKLRARRAGRTC